MKYRLTKLIGANQFTFEGEAQSHEEFFEQAAFYSSLPSVCGNGSCRGTDLKIEFKVTKEGYKYSSIFCTHCKYRLAFGAVKNPIGSLFKKTWALDEFAAGKEGEPVSKAELDSLMSPQVSKTASLNLPDFPKDDF